MVKLTLIQGDCQKVLPTLPDESVDLILTDPMYNISTTKKIQRSKFYNPKYKRPSDIDFNFFGEKDRLSLEQYLDFTTKWLLEAYRILKKNGSIYVFFPRSEISFLEHIMLNIGFKVRSTCVWHKNNPVPNQLNISFSSAAEFFTFATKEKGKKHTFNSGKGLQNVFKFPLCQGKERLAHPTQKPLKLIEQLIEISSNPNDLVLDCYLGAGTTMAACLNLKRNCIGVEINPDYIKMCKQRLWSSTIGDVEFEYREVKS